MSQSMPAPPAGYAHAPPPPAHHHQQPHPGQPQAVPQHGYQPAPQHHQGHHLPPPPHQPQHGHAYPPHPHGQPLPPPPASAMLHSAHQPPPQALPPTQMTRPEVSIQRGDNIVQSLMPLSLTDEKTNRKFSLDVAQQPIRARMCGFGDKDRRPITPPPCVRLIITDLTTGKEIDPNEIEHSLFVLNVDLWNEDGSREFNLVRSSTGSPSISSTTPFSYSALNGGVDATQSQYNTQMMPSNREQTSYGQTGGVGYVQDYQMQQSYAPVAATYPQGGTSYGPAQQYYPHQSYRPEGGITSLPSQSMAPYGRNGMPPGYGPDETAMSRAIGQPVDQRGGMFTRNLIGSLAASAFKLSDTNDRLGIWFILQDLSVRTEGAFRLRFSFVNVGAAGGIKAKDDVAAKLNTGRAPILASCFSEVFNVYSAKKFPGVCESTPLSKTFATQGIKIPIRKDTNVRGGGDDDDVYD